MILCYTLVLFLLVAIKFLTDRRATAYERKFARLALDAEKLVREPVYRQGNSGVVDPYQVAKRQFQLGMLIQKRDRLESKSLAWQRTAERLAQVVESVRSWKGRKLPYTFGVLDVSVLLGLIDYLGVGEALSARRFLELITALLAN